MADINARKRGKKWEYYFEIAKMDGKRKRISKGGFNTKAEAVSEGVKAMHEYQTAGTVNTPSELSMHDYLNYWIEMYCIPNLKPTTVANYKKYIRLHISPKIGKYRLVTITAEQLQKLINDMVANGYSKNTVIGIWLTLTFLNPLAAVAPGAYVLWQNMVNALQLWYKQKYGRLKW